MSRQGKMMLDLNTCQKDESGTEEISYFNPNMQVRSCPQMRNIFCGSLRNAALAWQTVWTDDKESADERKKFTSQMEKDVKGKLEPLFEVLQSSQRPLLCLWFDAPCLLCR